MNFVSMILWLCFLELLSPMQHVELFNYENLTLKTVENLFSPSRR